MTTSVTNNFGLKSFSLNEDHVYYWSIIYTLNETGQEAYSPSWWFKTKKLADLVIRDVKFPPDAVMPGSDFLISWLVFNIGKAITSSSLWYETIYGCDQNNFNQAIYLGRVRQNRYLEPNGFYKAEFKLNLPERYKLDNYFLWIIVDKENYLDESNRLNNQFSDIVNVARLPLPNLVVKTLTLNLDQPKAGKSLELKYTVENIGETNAKPNRLWFDIVLFKKGNQIAFRKEVSIRLSSGLDVKANYSNTILFNVPKFSFGSGFSMEIVTNFKDYLYESDLDDNGYLKELDVLGPDTPDLDLTRLELNKNDLKTGEILKVSYEVWNEGIEDANEASWHDLCQIKNNNSEIVLKKEISITGPVLKQTSYNRTFEINLVNSLRDSLYTVELKVDYLNKIFVYNPASSSIRSNTSSIKITRSIPIWELSNSSIKATRVNIENTVAYKLDISYRLVIRNELNLSTSNLKWADEFFFSYRSTFDIKFAIKLGESNRIMSGAGLNTNSSFIFYEDDVWNGNLFAYFVIDSGNIYEKVNEFSNPYRVSIVLNKIISTLNLTEFQIGNLSLVSEFYNVGFGFKLKNNGPKLLKTPSFDVFIRNGLNKAWSKVNEFKLDYDLEVNKEYRVESAIKLIKSYNGQLYMKIEASNKFDYNLVAAQFGGTINNSASFVIEQVRKLSL